MWFDQYAYYVIAAYSVTAAVLSAMVFFSAAKWFRAKRASRSNINKQRHK